MKRGQISIFVILGIVILLLITIILFFSKSVEINRIESESSEILSFNNQVRSIEAEILRCIEDVTETGLSTIAQQGGYIVIPQGLATSGTAYWYKDGINFQPFLSEMVSRLNGYTVENLPLCTNPLFEKRTGMNISTSGKISSQIKITKSSLQVSIKYPVDIRKEENKASLSRFKTRVDSNIWYLYDKATRIINDATLPSFDKCSPVECGDDDAMFTFYNEGDDLIIKGQLYTLINEKKSSLELVFAIKRPISESFGPEPNKKKAAIIYQDVKNMGTFGKKALEVFEKLIPLGKGVDTFDCSQIHSFFENSENYDILIITGDPENKVVNAVTKDIIMGCNEISKNYQLKLKNWVNEGGILWINGVDKNEGDNFDGSYLGAMGYSSIGWETVDLDSLQNVLLKILENSREETADVKMPNHNLINCPHKLSEEFSKSTWFGNSLNTKSKANEIILGSESKSLLWVDHVGNGIIVFDEFILKDNLFSELPYNDDLISKDLAEMYYKNVLTYISALAYDQSLSNEPHRPKLIQPSVNAVINTPKFVFKSSAGTEHIYHFVVTDSKGESGSVVLDSSNFGEQNNLDGVSKIWASYQNSSYFFIVQPISEEGWAILNPEMYEWQVGVKEEDKIVWSEISRFVKRGAT